MTCRSTSTGPAAVTLETFQSGLAPYGDWVRTGAYGTAWRPRVAPGWRPYYYGRWEWTNEGWLWVSDEPFGWATYHYGRWAWDGGTGLGLGPRLPVGAGLGLVAVRRGRGGLGTAGAGAVALRHQLRLHRLLVDLRPLGPLLRDAGLGRRLPAVARLAVLRRHPPGAAAPPAAAGGPARRRAARRARRPRSRPTPGWGGPPPRYIEERTGRPVQASRIVRAAVPRCVAGTGRRDRRLPARAAPRRRRGRAPDRPGRQPWPSVPPAASPQRPGGGWDRGAPPGRAPAMPGAAPARPGVAPPRPGAAPAAPRNEGRPSAAPRGVPAPSRDAPARGGASPRGSSWSPGGAAAPGGGGRGMGGRDGAPPLRRRLDAPLRTT